MEGIANNMYSISKWGKANPWKARIFIALSHLLLFPMAFFTGILLRDIGLIFDKYWLTGTVVCCVVLFLFYPQKRHTPGTRRHASYWRQKRFDFGVLAAGWLGLVLIANRDFQDVASVPAVFAVSGASIEVSPAYELTYYGISEGAVTTEHERPIVIQSKKEKRKAMREQMREVRKDGELSTVAKVLLILLIVVLSAAIGAGVGAIACQLACSGNGAAAVVVIILGVVGVFSMLIFGIRSVLRKKANRHPTVKPEEQPVS